MDHLLGALTPTTFTGLAGDLFCVMCVVVRMHKGTTRGFFIPTEYVAPGRKF